MIDATMADLSLRAHVEKLALLREEVAQRKVFVDAKRAEFEVTIAEAARNLESCKRAVEAAEADVRGLTLVAHATTGNAKPCAGVSVVMTKAYVVDEPAAFAWAQITKICLIPESLDLKAITRLASVNPLTFVTVTESPAVRIASNLAAALAEVTL